MWLFSVVVVLSVVTREGLPLEILPVVGFVSRKIKSCLFWGRMYVCMQVEFYFSDTNLPTDHHLMKYVKKDPQGFGAC